jgi:hypothetical protein
MVVTAKFPKFCKIFIRVLKLENLPRSTTDVGVATAESLRHHIQHYASASVKIIHTKFASQVSKT